ncbi:MAG TPA: hypothetical protein VH372_18675 [Actinospica sp.]|nr:hypothetical protein [Actinospica sp.]
MSETERDATAVREYERTLAEVAEHQVIDAAEDVITRAWIAELDQMRRERLRLAMAARPATSCTRLRAAAIRASSPARLVDTPAETRESLDHARALLTSVDTALEAVCAEEPMSIGANISVITAGAVLAFATRVHAAGVSIQAVGVVLMLAGIVSFALRIGAVAKQRELTMQQAYVPPEKVLVRPVGAHQQPYGPVGHTGTTADPLPREDSPFPAADEYGYGNQW